MGGPGGGGREVGDLKMPAYVSLPSWVRGKGEKRGICAKGRDANLTTHIHKDTLNLHSRKHIFTCIHHAFK